MKLKLPAICSYAGMGSRGAWTGNALLPRSFGKEPERESKEVNQWYRAPMF
ncbi:hypothetical protein BBR47_51690 [Brevibacillus brevis NBRC 100599]|uniref:Uncharacterized protein n=1 Tax=Brevibacillus brevis (strain 47 / JCM 6285 / NBRC 100599) TaxID=358681 RepID=C0Z5P0_BREBN|nr:hypothetical protein BBR47_51690 [Brevibacillus brevis NBRC 100599]